MATTRRIAALLGAGVALSASALPALAHHVMGGKMPATFAQGFLSGVGHPIIGVDHFLFIVGVGLLAGALGQKLLLPATFVVGTLVGAALHLLRLDVPFAEVAIVISVLLMAAAVISNLRLPLALTAGLIGLAGVFHGYAYAESIFGAEPTPLYAYLAGFAIIQFLVAFAAASVFGMLQKRSGALATTSVRIAGGAMIGVALVSLSAMLFPVSG